MFMSAEKKRQDRIKPLLKEHAVKAYHRDAVSVTHTSFTSVHAKSLYRVILAYNPVVEVHKM
jgi:hypothetical protein